MTIFRFYVWAVIIQVFSALAIAGYVITATVSLIPKRNVDRARLLVAEGVIVSLSLMVAAALLRTIELQTWRQILVFSVLLSLRIVLKKLFVWEKTQLIKHRY